MALSDLNDNDPAPKPVARIPPDMNVGHLLIVHEAGVSDGQALRLAVAAADFDSPGTTPPKWFGPSHADKPRWLVVGVVHDGADVLVVHNYGPGSPHRDHDLPWARTASRMSNEARRKGQCAGVLGHPGRHGRGYRCCLEEHHEGPCHTNRGIEFTNRRPALNGHKYRAHDRHDQPPPRPNDEGPSIQDLVIGDMEKRKAVGLERYGTLLRPDNGRDMLRDAYEEALDLAVYLRGAIEERGPAR